MARGYLQIAQYHLDAALGKEYVYLAGGTNLANVYDPVSGDAISNPVSIAADGYVQAFVVDDSTLFDLRVVDLNGTTVFTRQNVSVLGGTSGSVGPQGPQGVKGDKGDTGAQGAQGAAGTNGTNGTNGTDGEDGISLVSIRINETTETGRVEYNKSDDPNTWIVAGDLMPDGIGQVKLYAEDSLGYMADKLEAGDGISIGQPNSNSVLTIENSAPETFKTQASQYATVKDFLNVLIEGTSGVTVTTSADFNKIIISGSGIGGSGFTPRGAWNGSTTYVEGDGVWYYDSSVTPVINRYYVATATNTNSNPYTVGTGWVIMFSIDQLGDQMVKLDSSDSTTGFLLSKIVAGQGITFTRTVDAGGDFITIDGTPVFSVGVNGTDKTISELANIVDLVDGEVNEVVWDGNTIKVNHDTYDESGTAITQTATGLPKFDAYGHYKGSSDAIEISDVSGLESAIAAAGDGKVQIDAEDTKGYLISKITAGTGIIITDNGSSLEISKDSVDSLDSYVISSAASMTAPGQIPLSISATKDWVESGNMLIAPRSSVMQLNFSAKVTYTNIGTIGFSAYNDSFYVNVSNKLVSMDAVTIGGYPWNLTDAGDTFLGAGNVHVIEIPVAGRYQFDLSYVSEATSNTSSSNGSCALWHYSSSGTVKQIYRTSEWTGYTPVGGQSSDSRDNPSLTIQPDCAAGDVLALRITADAYTRISDIWVSGHAINAKYSEIGDSNAITLAHYDSTGALKQYHHIVAPTHDFSGMHDYSWSNVFNVIEGDKFAVYWAKADNTYSISDVNLSIISSYGAKGDKGDKGDPGDPGTAGEATLDGLLTFPIILSDTNISTGHTSDQGATYASSRVITAASVEANFMSCFFTQVGSFYSLRMGIYTPGSNGDILIAQTEVYTNTPALGICTMPITRDGAGNLLTETLYLDPNTSYMPAVIIKANATNLAAYQGLSTNPPNHFGRYDSWNAPSPIDNLMPATASFSQSNTFPWLAISK